MRQAVPVMAFGRIEEYNILPDEWEWSAADRARILRVLATRGLTCSDQDAYVMWADFSQDRCATWVTLPPTDEDLLRCLQPHYTVPQQGLPDANPDEHRPGAIGQHKPR